nr:phage tail protein [Alysiella crassa]UOP08067.1 phage tail protein [Alysiella crassa]
MANLRETATWEAGIYQWETSDPVMGGENGIDNRPTRQLANRTLWLKNEIARAIALIGTNQQTATQQFALKTTSLTAGAGLSGGGVLRDNMTLSLGTPSKITATSQNSAVSNTHTHEIDKATTSVAGIVKLNNTLTSDAQNEALTAAQGKILAEQIAAKTWDGIVGKPVLQQVQDMRSPVPSITPVVAFQDATPEQLPVGVYEGFSDKAKLTNVHINGSLKTVKLWRDRTGAVAIYRESKLPNGEVWRQYANGNLSGWGEAFRIDGVDWANIRDKPNTFSGYGITGSQSLSGSIELTNAYPAVVLKSTATGTTKKWLFEASADNAYFVQRDSAANSGGVLLNLPTRAGTLALDGDVVKLSGNQTIGGEKTFSGSLNVLSASGVSVKHSDRTFVFAIGTDSCYLHNTKSSKTLRLKDNGTLTYAEQPVYHGGNKPTWADLGYAPVQQGGGVGQNNNAIKIGWSGSRLKAQVDNTDLGNIVFDSQLDNAVPSGTVVYFLGTNAPSGWLKANGAAISRTTYSRLFAAIGTHYGAGDGSTTFNIPDLRGEFLRVWDDGRGNDAGRILGSWQGDELRSHSHGTNWGLYHEAGVTDNAIASGNIGRWEGSFNLATAHTGGRRNSSTQYCPFSLH